MCGCMGVWVCGCVVDFLTASPLPRVSASGNSTCAPDRSSRPELHSTASRLIGEAARRSSPLYPGGLGAPMKRRLTLVALTLAAVSALSAGAAQLRIMEPLDRSIVRGTIYFQVKPELAQTDQFLAPPDVL